MTTTSTIPAKITQEDLYKAAGANVLPERVQFVGDIYDGTLAHANTPIEAIDGFKDAVISTFDITERTEEYPGYTQDELSIALDAVLSLMEGGISQIISSKRGGTPSTRRVPVGYNMATKAMDYVVVPDSASSLPGFRGPKGEIWVVVGTSYGIPYVKAQIIRGDQSQIEGLFKFVRDWADQNSIYLGQVIDTNFEFINLTRFDPTKIALDAKLRSVLDLFVMGPLKRMSAILAEGLPPKTGVMLYGPPGGGKSVCVALCEKAAITYGAVVIHVDPAMGVEGFQRADLMATRLMKAGHMVLIAMEDMEKLATDARAKVLEILDGVSSKDSRRIIIGTSNFLEKMDRAMLRAGRFDGIAFCGLPDRGAFEQVIRVIIRAERLGEIDFEEAFTHFEGMSYAFIANAAQTILRSAINRTDGDLDGLKIVTADLIAAADAVRDHHDMMSDKVEESPDRLENLLTSVAYHGTNMAANAGTRFRVHDATSYDKIGEVVDNVIEARLDGAGVSVEDGDGNEFEGRLRTC